MEPGKETFDFFFFSLYNLSGELRSTMFTKPFPEEKTKLLVLIWVLLSTLTLSSATRTISAEPADLNLLDEDGKQVRLRDFTSSKPVLLYFWATWCKPCRKISPKVRAFSEKYKDQVQVMAVNVGGLDSLEKIREYRKKYRMDCPVFLDSDNKALKTFDILAIPAFVLIDSSGKVRFRNTALPKDLEGLLSS
jgi:thiol-disulfide isomerase/thioredoxin